MARSTRNPMSVADFEALLARSSVGQADSDADRSVVEDGDVARVVAASAFTATTPEATELAARRATHQARQQGGQLLEWTKRLAAAMSADGRLFTYTDGDNLATALDQLHGAGPGDVLLLCGTNTPAVESLEVLRAARAAGLVTWAVAPGPASGIRELTDELMEIDGTSGVQAAQRSVLHTFETLLDASPHRLGTSPAAIALAKPRLVPVADAASEQGDERVYCGLASADVPVVAGRSALTVAVVDDAGRLLVVREIDDDPGGYAELGMLLVERTSRFADAAVAADSDDHLVSSLLIAAGRPLVTVGDDTTGDFAGRFADDDSVEEMSAPQSARRAVGLARALQAGAIAPVIQPTPRELVSYKPVLAAHVALLGERNAAIVGLREVLRELYPAALRAYPDPAHPLALAVLDLLPEPGRLTARGAEPQQVAEQVVTKLIRSGAGSDDQIIAAVTALHVAISESPRHGGVNKSLAPVVAETVRRAIAAVRACDAACASLIGTIAARPVLSTTRRARQAEPESQAVEPASRWSEVASTGRPTFPADGVGWRTETAEWRATGARWRQTTEWRSTTDSHGWRSTTEAWQPGDSSSYTPPTEAPSSQPAISSTALSSEQPSDEPRPLDPRSGETAPQAASVSAPTGRVKPPWKDLPPDSPALRLAEPRPGGGSLDRTVADLRAISEPAALRMVDSERWRTAPPVQAGNDDTDLLIFAAARSAWFIEHSDTTLDRDWTSPNDSGWRAAERAATPEIAGDTAAGLPQRVPGTNLVPGSPQGEERPLRIVRDAASIAAHTAGYFRGWRRGQEIGGFAMGGRPGREAAEGWDFTRGGSPTTEEDAEWEPTQRVQPPRGTLPEYVERLYLQAQGRTQGRVEDEVG
jgi:hypothetical protein